MKRGSKSRKTKKQKKNNKANGRKWYKAASIERQYINGKVDDELFYRYLKEYARKKQTESEVNRAIVCKKDGKSSYRWLDMKEKWLGAEIGELPCWPTEKEIEEYFPKDSPVKWWTDEKWYNHHPIEDTFVKHWKDQVAEKMARLKQEEDDTEDMIDDFVKVLEQ